LYADQSKRILIQGMGVMVKDIDGKDFLSVNNSCSG
jgi:hypothetical protein